MTEATLLGEGLLIALQCALAATPLVLAGLGELIAERAGVINVGIEGLIATGAIAGAAAAAWSGSGWVGLVGAVAAAMVLGALFACASVYARVDQIVCGMAINLIAVGGAGTAWQVLQAHSLDQVPQGGGFASHYLGVFGLTWVTLALAGIAWWCLRATRWGVIVRALGDEPDAAAAAGVAVARWRVALVALAAALAGLAGTFYSLMRVTAYTPGTSSGAGFLVLALVIFGRWSVPGLLGGCLLFGAIDALQHALQASGYNAHVPYQLLTMLPYLAALAALAMLSRSAPGPRCLGEPWPRRR